MDSTAANDGKGTNEKSKVTDQWIRGMETKLTDLCKRFKSGGSGGGETLMSDLVTALSELEKQDASTPDRWATTELKKKMREVDEELNKLFRRTRKVQYIDLVARCLKMELKMAAPNGVERPGLLVSLGISRYERFLLLGHRNDIDEAIGLQSEAITPPPKDCAELHDWHCSLGGAYRARYERFEDPGDIKKAIELHSLAVLDAPTERGNMFVYLCNLGLSHASRYFRLGELEDIKYAIDYHSKAVLLTPEGHADKCVSLNCLGRSYHAQYSRLAKIEDIEKAIKYHTEAVSLTPNDHANRSSQLLDLAYSYHLQYHNSHSPSALANAIKYFGESALSPTGDPRRRLRAALRWATIAPLKSDPETLLAFGAAIDLIPRVVWMGQTVSQRYDDVQEIGDLATRAAAAAITAGKYDQALEWLEQARSVVWTQILQLRTPFDQLSSVNQVLAEKLRLVTTELHDAGNQLEDEAALPNAELLEQAAQRHRLIAKQYDELVKEARSIKGFENFMRPKKASELLQAARTGPVVAVNVHESRSDALILLPGQTKVAHLRLPNLSLGKVQDARAGLYGSLYRNGLRERKLIQAGSREVESPDEVFFGPLNMLWTDVAEPVLNYLKYKPNSNVANLPHITWCTTGSLSFLPLHAATRFNDRKPGAKLSDYAISSYTPTVGALFSAHPVSPIKHSSILCIGQGNTPGHNSLPMVATELVGIEKCTPPPLRFTKLTGNDATPDTVLADMARHDWVHLACHAHQDQGDPMRSGFLLHGGELSLAKIMQKSFTNKGLAFLSACQTARGDEKLPDEVVHLASGMLLAGYPSVVATIWSMMDRDGPVISNKVYAEIIKDGAMDHTKVARALHFAVKELRETLGGERFARWVPFIHMGV